MAKQSNDLLGDAIIKIGKLAIPKAGAWVALDKLSSESMKHDNGKLPYHLLPPEPIEELVKILQFGAKKYKPNSWQDLPDFKDRYYSALQRHLASWRKGQLLDSESGLPHLAHAFCCLMFLLWREVKNA